jgi:hypothetical protein
MADSDEKANPAVPTAADMTTASAATTDAAA